MFEDLLDFWFGDVPPQGPVPPERLRFWFTGGDETDGRIRERFENLVQRGAGGEFDSWSSSPRGRLALIVLLDQFPRNIHRKTPAAYAHDPKALELSLAGLRAGDDRSLATLEKAFFYLPLEHSEDLRMQEQSVDAFRRLLEEAPAALKAPCESFYDYAVRHRDVIARFGRFPHRNRVLGRASTPEEEEFLTQPGSSF